MVAGADVLSRKAAGLFRAGRIAEAIKTYRELLSENPERPDDWLNLGLVLRRSGEFRGALTAYREALAQGIRDPEEVHLNSAVVLTEDLLDLEAARAELEVALKLRPDYAPALLNLGNLYEDMGDREKARDAYSKALGFQPDSALALMRLAEVSRFSSPDDFLIVRMKERLSSGKLSPLERADLGYSLGRALDECGAYDTAFEAYRSANEGSRALATQSYDRQGAETFIDALIEAFPARVSHTENGDAPIFICGMFRSGSTFVERILAAHSEVSAGGELPILPKIVREKLRQYPASLSGKADKFFADLGTEYLASLAQMKLEPTGLTDKRPDNFLHVGLIKRMFPRAKVVLTRRNPLDNCLSVYFAHLDPSLTYASSLATAAHWYRQYERLAEHWLALYPDDIRVADYDALVRDPRGEVEGLLKFLDLPWENACLEPHIGSGQVRTASAWQVREPLYTSSSGRWRNYTSQLGSLFAEFGRLD
jgi:tetratricopeptide (TPR) repeat protein